MALENAIYEDTRFMMQRISREIRQNTVDYEDITISSLTTCTVIVMAVTHPFYNPG